MKNGLVLLTGFLGAGKTTFLNHILHEYEDCRVGMVVNEFSGTGVDGAVIRKDIKGAEMVELNNGSIFCACIKDHFVDSLVDLGKRDLEYVFVEASGLADPSSIVSILDQIRDFRGVQFNYLGSICLADAVNFPEHSKVLISLRRQVKHSRAVVLNKTDLVSEERLKVCEDAIREIRPDIDIFRTTYGQVSLKEVLKLDAAAEPEAEESTNTVESRPITVTLTTREVADPERLKDFLMQIAPCTYRIKGFCLTTEGAMNVSMVGRQFTMEPWPEEVPMTQLVIISSVGIRVISETLEAGKKCYSETFELK